MNRWKIALALCLLAGVRIAVAAEAKPLVQDEAVEQRMILITQDLRCLVCQNESLAASHAELAEDLRREVRELIRQGKTDQEVVDYLVARYGNFVRYRPPFEASTALLWIGPFALLALGTGLLVWHVKRRDRGAPRPLDDEERERAAQLLVRIDAEDRS